MGSELVQQIIVIKHLCHDFLLELLAVPAFVSPTRLVLWFSDDKARRPYPVVPQIRHGGRTAFKGAQVDVNIPQESLFFCYLHERVFGLPNERRMIEARQFLRELGTYRTNHHLFLRGVDDILDQPYVLRSHLRRKGRAVRNQLRALRFRMRPRLL